MGKNANERNPYLNTKVKGTVESDFEGCTTFPNSKGNIINNQVTGSSHGKCSRCENYSNHISSMGFCPTCESYYDKNNRNQAQKKYIKAGTRSYVDL